MPFFAARFLACACVAMAVSGSVHAQATAGADAAGTVGGGLDVAPIGIFARAVAAAGLTGELSGQMPVTIYAPSDAAMKAMEPGTLDTLMRPENKDLLKDFLHAHMVWGTYDIAAMRRMDAAAGSADVPTIALTAIHFRVTGENDLTVTDGKGNEARISPHEIVETNGVIEVIDRVLAPPQQPEVTIVR